MSWMHFRVHSISFALLILSSALGCQKSPGSSHGKSPKIAVVQPVRNLGAVSLGQHTETFEVTNTGTAELCISRIERSCSCVKVSIDRDVIPSGESAYLRVLMSPRESEQRNVSVGIHSNDPIVPMERVSLQWTAQGAVSTDKQYIDFGVVRPMTTVTQKLTVTRSLAELPATFATRVRISPADVLQADLNSAIDSDGLRVETWQISLRAGNDVDEHTGRLLYNYEGSDQGSVSIPLVWSIRDSVEVSPKRLFLGTARPKETVTKVLKVTSEKAKHICVNRVEWSNLGVPISTETILVHPEMVEIRVEFTYPDALGTHVGELRIHCDSPETTSFVVPVALVVGSQERRIAP